MCAQGVSVRHSVSLPSFIKNLILVPCAGTVAFSKQLTLIQGAPQNVLTCPPNLAFEVAYLLASHPHRFGPAKSLRKALWNSTAH